ncbi:hypothetical protein BGZ80_008453 [Entomortierella chlamydospora]|uniref:DIS3-like exonuclease 2 n=1 Tax=Entomortierella chlamydospora TaxID=101097 RepID=A0A9P6MXG9_9FUNG|nr:hypothetical protein BGZ80_008453 [Entomortierella chlamydospora]
MASTVPPTTPAPAPTPADVSSNATNATAADATKATAALSRKRSQKSPRNKDKESSKDTDKDNSASKDATSSSNSNDKKDSKDIKTPKKEKKARKATNASGAEAASSPAQPAQPAAAVAVVGAVDAAVAAPKQGSNKKRNSKSAKTPAHSDTATTTEAASSSAFDVAPTSSDQSPPKKQRADGSKKDNGRRPPRKQQHGKSSSSPQNQEQESLPNATKGSVEPTANGDSTASAPSTLTPKQSEKLSTSTNANSNHNNNNTTNTTNTTTTNNNNNNNNDDSNNNNNGNSNKKKSKKKSSNAKEPIPSPSVVDVDAKASTDNIPAKSADTDAPPTKKPKEKGTKKGHVKDDAAETGKKSNRNADARQNKANNVSASESGSSNTQKDPIAKGKDRRKNNKASKDKGDTESATKVQPASKDARPSSISSSCSFVTSSSSLSPTSPASPISPSTPLSFASPMGRGHHPLSPAAADDDRGDVTPKGAGRGGARNKSSKNEKVTSIKTNVSRDGSSNFSGPSSASSLTSSNPSSRRSSAFGSFGDKFGRHGGLPTVEENVSEKQPVHDQLPAGASKRRHTRSLSIKDQFDLFNQNPQEHRGEGTVESLQEIISALKNLPPPQSSVGEHSQTNGSPHHERRLSMSSQPHMPSTYSRNSIGPLSNAPTTTTLHISQPPPGMSIETAVQSTVATIRRLSISDSRRPLLPLKENEAETAASVNDKAGKRRSITFSKDAASIAGETFESRRTSVTSGYRPNRRSVVIKPEEVAALQEGRPYIPTSLDSLSNDESSGVANALSALEGKAPSSNRSSYSAKGSHQRSGSSVDPNSLAEFTAKLPEHIKGAGVAPLVNNDDAHDRRRFTTAAFHSTTVGSSRASINTKVAPSRRLSAMPTTKESDRKDRRMSTPATSNGHYERDSVSLKDNASNRRPLFVPHLTYSDFHTLSTKQKHKYVQGVLRINKRDRSEAYVTVDTLPEGDVYICGSKDRNRALEGDVVGIELIDSDDPSQQKLEGNKDKRKGKRNGDTDEVEDAGADETKPKYCGRVVSIVERSASQMFSGTLTLQRPNNTSKKSDRKTKDEDDQKGHPRIVWFKPTDKRVPLIAIPIDQAPTDFVENHSSYLHKLFVATIKRWPLSSLHPFGQLERELGDIGDIEIETEALLADNNVATTPFGEKVEKCLPEQPWTIPEKEISKRRDLRKSCIFTIDPSTAKDLDDAVSCTRLEDGTLEIGVHIADVSHFIKTGSALDREAKSRATTVYLVQKAIPMLPNILCEDLCSLVPCVDRLAFSVFWKMTEDGEILDTSFSKSVIRSCAQLSYDDAQNVITTGSLDPNVEVVGQPRSLVEENIKIFFKLSQILREKRFENGALSINSIKLSFKMDEIFNPLDVSIYELKESNKLIEEFMLLANMSVAKQICEHFPDVALLRRHEAPLERRMLDFISHMSKIGLNLDASSSASLQRSLNDIQDPDMRKVVRLLVIKPMQKAKYICAGMLNPDKYRHYALNAPLYTHFTSPIRRYADIIVHRMLEASLAGETKFYLTKENCQKSANHCNIKKDASKVAQEQSSHIYLSVLLRNMREYGLEKRVYLDQLPVERHSWNGTTETLKLYWTTEAFKAVEEEVDNSNGNGKSRRLSALAPAHFDAMDHPDDATNAYDDERGLFDDESDYYDEEDDEDR